MVVRMLWQKRGSDLSGDGKDQWFFVCPFAWVVGAFYRDIGESFRRNWKEKRGRLWEGILVWGFK